MFWEVAGLMSFFWIILHQLKRKVMVQEIDFMIKYNRLFLSFFQVHRRIPIKTLSFKSVKRKFCETENLEWDSKIGY